MIIKYMLPACLVAAISASATGSIGDPLLSEAISGICIALLDDNPADTLLLSL